MITDNPIVIEPQNQADSVVIWLHGLGADGHDFADLPQALNHPNLMNTRYIFPHAPTRPVSLNGGLPMPAWHDITSLDRTNAQDQAGLEESSAYLNQLVSEQLKKGIAPNRIIFGGFSQGAAQVLYSGTRSNHSIAGIIALSGYLPDMNQTPAATVNRPILVMHGNQDDVVLPEFGQESAEHLKTLQYPVEFKSYPIGHSVCPEEVAYLRGWLGERLG